MPDSILSLTASMMASLPLSRRLSTSLHPRLLYMLTDHSTSVVAVHGLNFKGNTNHAWATWTKGDKLWLKDLLPTSLPEPARIMLFAYNSSPAIGAAAIKLDDHAKSLLLWLNIKRKASCSTSTLQRASRPNES
jgi:hypothetical protein